MFERLARAKVAHLKTCGISDINRIFELTNNNKRKGYVFTNVGRVALIFEQT